MLAVLAASLILPVATQAIEITEGFSGRYDPENWETVQTGPATVNLDGRVDTTKAPSSISIIGQAWDTCTGDCVGTIDYLITIPSGGTLSFQWSYTTGDEDPYWDPFGYVINEDFTILIGSDVLKWPVQTELVTGVLEAFINAKELDPLMQSDTGFVSLNVNLGDRFGFRILTRDGLNGRATVTISMFSGPTAQIPTPPSLALFGLGVILAAPCLRGRWRQHRQSARDL